VQTELERAVGVLCSPELADHGMEHNAEDVTGDWGDALSAAGLSCRDEASGFLYLGT
jgi:hypothetical protein